MHTQARDWLAWTQQVIPRMARTHVLEVGSLNVNGSAREYFQGESLYYRGIDIIAGPGVDIVIDAKDYDEFAGNFNLIVCTEVFEHSPWWDTILERMYHNLMPLGWLVLTCASDLRKPHSAYGAEHPTEGEYYQGVFYDDLAQKLEDLGFIVVKLEHVEDPGDLRVLAQRGP